MYNYIRKTAPNFVPMPRATGLKGPRAQGDFNIYYYKIRVSFAKKILSFRSAFIHEIEKSSSIREFADLLIIKNHFMSSSFPEVCTAFLLLVTIPAIRLVPSDHFQN